MRKFFRLAVVTLPIITMAVLVGISSTIAGERQFFNDIQGQWVGPGEIVAGKHKGTKFTCKFKGYSDKKITGMKVDGSCRVGIISQPISAVIVKRGGRYSGKFLDGASGNGMDVVGGRYTQSRMVAKIKRNALLGTMVARLDNNQRLNVTFSVKVQGQSVPLIGMSLKKVRSF